MRVQAKMRSNCGGAKMETRNLAAIHRSVTYQSLNLVFLFFFFLLHNFVVLMLHWFVLPLVQHYFVLPSCYDTSSVQIDILALIQHKFNQRLFCLQLQGSKDINIS